MLKLKSILVPTDFSENADAAIQLAASLARDHSATLVILHVAPPPTYFTGEGMVTPLPPTDLEPLKKRLETIQPSTAPNSVKRLFCEGDPISGILTTANETQCDLIVMGTHGRTGLSRLLMGSVAEEIVRRAKCPVLTVKTPFETTTTTRKPPNDGAAAAI